MIEALSHIHFANPELLFLLLLLPVFALAYYRNSILKKAAISDPTAPVRSGIMGKLFFMLALLKLLSVAALIFALARPQSTLTGKRVKNSEGIDIAIAMDVSSSMLAMDFKPNRLEAAKKVAKEFVLERQSDRIALVAYAAESFTQIPLTSDKHLVINALEKVRNGQLEDGTAIGLGLATSVNRLKDSKAKSKVVILLTDGVNNAGSIDPITASELAKEFNIRVYTIGVGTRGMAPFPARDFFGNSSTVQQEVKIDEDLLKEIATNTNGQYFRATNNATLQEIYKSIDQLETSKLEELQYMDFEEKFHPLVLLAFILLALEYLFKHTIFKGIA